jgi:hypothetical protein
MSLEWLRVGVHTYIFMHMAYQPANQMVGGPHYILSTKPSCGIGTEKQRQTDSHRGIILEKQDEKYNL